MGLAGAITAAMASFKKAKITNEDTQESITCLYNPTTLKTERSACWKPSPIKQMSFPEYTYSGGGGASITMELLFDATSGLVNLLTTGGKVTKYVEFLHKLMDVTGQEERPPYCRFEWGGYQYIPSGFTAFVESVSTEYTLFRATGVPVRAKATVKFVLVDEGTAGQNPTTRTEARKTWVVREGERLDWIAYMEYGDAAHWRHIAEINGIDDPFTLHSGQVLMLTPLT
jgi:hypothetical protein